MLDDQLNNALKELIKQWNIAERRIKKAEQVRGNEVVSSAIFELRYAGRKIIDAIELVLDKDWKNDDKSYNKIRSFLDDAAEDCVKAKHDAIDSMLDFVTTWFARIEVSLGLSKVQLFFPEYFELTSKISDIQEKISQSRGNRNTLRDGVYDEIERSGYDEIIQLYEKIKKSNERVGAEVKRERQEKAVLLWLAIGGFVVGIAGIAVAFLK